MKQRKTVKQLYKEHENGIDIFILVVVSISLFIAGFFVSWNFIEKPMSDSQFDMCEQIARDVYEQKGNVIIEVPEDFSVSITTTTITVKSADYFVRGTVDASLCNGKLVIVRNLENYEAISVSVLTGIAFILVAAFVFIMGVAIKCEVQERKQRRR